MPTGHYPRPSIMQRFEDKYIPEPNSGCWLWLGARVGDYGGIRHEGCTQYAHRVSYKLFIGDIPKGFDIDHKCQIRCCVNPDHLEAVTRHENLLRAWRVAVRASI